MKSLIQQILRPFGLRLARIKSPAEAKFGAPVLFSTLKRFGFAPHCIVDVGANHGNWTRSALDYFPNVQCILIEPQGHLKTYISDLMDSGSNIRWINAGISDKSGRMTFYISHRDDSSTFLHRDQLSGTIGSREVEVKTLDEILSECMIPVPDMVKIDAEGFDLRVLRGATRLLGKTDVFLVKAAVLCPFDNTVANVIAAMEASGYRLFDITELNRSPKFGVLWLVELAFLRKSSSLLDSVTSYEWPHKGCQSFSVRPRGNSHARSEVRSCAILQLKVVRRTKMS